MVMNLAESYIKNLKAQCGVFSADEAERAIDELTKKRIDEIRSTKTEVKVTGKCYYVSNDGCDDNDGLSPESAWKTTLRVGEAKKKGELCEGDGVFYRRGDTFRGGIEAASGVTYSAYGDGEKPKFFSFFRNVAQSELWKETDEPCVWEYTGDVSALDIGNIVFCGKTNARKIYLSVEDDGLVYDSRRNRKFGGYKDIVEDLSFWHDWERDGEFTGKLYLRCTAGNPGEVYDDIEFTERTSLFRVAGTHDVTIDNLCLCCSNFGVSGECRNERVQNCEFYWIGGCYMLGARKYTPSRHFQTPYGNGIEIYGEAVNFTVDNCYFWQIYDAAMTHQCGRGERAINNRNIRYTNNVCERCVYSVEIFYGESPLGNRSNYDCLVANNILRDGGGFGHEARPDTGVTALIRNGATMLNTKDYIVRNNIFDRSDEKIIQAGNDGASKAQYFDNIYVQYKGGRFCTRCGNEYPADENLPKTLSDIGTENHPTYFFI